MCISTGDSGVCPVGAERGTAVTIEAVPELINANGMLVRAAGARLFWNT